MKTYALYNEAKKYFDSGLEYLDKILKAKVITVEQLNKVKNVEYKKYMAFKNKRNSIYDYLQDKHFNVWKSLNCASIVCDVCKLSDESKIESKVIKSLYAKTAFDNIFEKFDPYGYKIYLQNQGSLVI